MIYFTSLAMRFLLFGDQISTEQMTVADRPIAFLSSIDRCAGNLARDVSHLFTPCVCCIFIFFCGPRERGWESISISVSAIIIISISTSSTGTSTVAKLCRKECTERTKREGGGKAILINCALSKSLSGGNQSPLIKLIMMMMKVVVIMMTTEDGNEDYDEEEEVQKTSNIDDEEMIAIWHDPLL